MNEIIGMIKTEGQWSTPGKQYDPELSQHKIISAYHMECYYNETDMFDLKTHVTVELNDFCEIHHTTPSTFYGCQDDGIIFIINDIKNKQLFVRKRGRYKGREVKGRYNRTVTFRFTEDFMEWYKVNR